MSFKKKPELTIVSPQDLWWCAFELNCELKNDSKKTVQQIPTIVNYESRCVCTVYLVLKNYNDMKFRIWTVQIYEVLVYKNKYKTGINNLNYAS